MHDGHAVCRLVLEDAVVVVVCGSAFFLPMTKYVSNKSLGIARPPSAFALYMKDMLAGHYVQKPCLRRVRRKLPEGKLTMSKLRQRWSIGCI